MSTKTKIVKRYESYPVSIVCDRCGREAFWEGDSEFEAQEFKCYADMGGYGSIIGDEVEWTLDLCQHCFVELCGDYIQYHNIEGD